MKRLTIRTCLVAAIVSGLAASLRLSAHDPIGSRVTWTGDIARIFQARCVGCHRVGNPDTMALTTYEEVRPWVSAIRQQVLSRKMPIWHAARGFGDFANDPSLSPFEVALIAAWANAGGPQGTAKANDSVVETTSVGGPHGPTARTGREVVLPCGTQTVTGRLLAVNPRLENGASASIATVGADGQEHVIAWIRDYDSRYPTTYWLRTPVDLSRGSRLVIDAIGTCRVTVTLAADRSTVRKR